MEKIKCKRKKNQRGECWKEAEWDCKVCKNLNEKYQKTIKNWIKNKRMEGKLIRSGEKVEEYTKIWGTKISRISSMKK